MDSILNQSEEEFNREEEKMTRMEKELTDFLDDSADAANRWHKAFLLAKSHPKLKHQPGLAALHEKILAFAEERNNLLDRYEAHLKDWGESEASLNESLEEIERYQADEDEIEREMERHFDKLEELQYTFYDICDKGLELNAHFEVLTKEVAKMKE